MSTTLAAQPGRQKPELRELNNQELIIVFPDGRWQYFHRYSQGDRTLFDPADASDGKAGEELERYPVFTGTVVPFEERVTVTEEDARKIAFRKAQLAQSAAEIAEERAAEAQRTRARLEEDLAAARRNRAGEEELRHLEIRLEAASRTEGQTSREAQLALQESARAGQLAARGNYISELRATPTRPTAATDRPGGAFYEQVAFLDQPLSPGSFPMQPPAPACRLSYEGQDEYTGMQRRDVQKELLFTHTDERLRLYLKDKDYLRCEGSMTSLAGGYRYLSLEFTFAYPNAREAYGFIEKGSYLVIRLLDGQAIYLQSSKMDKGSYDTERELLTYRVHYPINAGVINTLRRGEIDTVRMYWSSGFEEYEVYNLNFFRNQIRCLEE